MKQTDLMQANNQSEQQPISPSPTLPTEDNHFKAHYSVWIGSVMLFSGLTLCATSISSMVQSNSFDDVIITGVLSAIGGYFFLTQPYFILAPNRLTIYNMLGKVIKRYPFETFGNLKIERNTLYIEGSFLERNHREPTRLKKWLVKAKDWEKLKTIIEQ